MKKGLIVQRQVQPAAQPHVMEENMSNLTSASNEASVSSVNRNDNGSYPPQQYFVQPASDQSQITQPLQPPAAKKKRNLPGNPDPDAEVIALSPKTLMATNRFVCEICNKGFQRDQNLQLHRRGHNLPWKLKQRANKDVIRKKVYVCPEVGCVHHDPSRALGDLTGIKKHFCRKHGEKKWKCDKCSKRYAVQSDWKAHSKTCGTREYRCDCGTLFSRRDSFITHRAFCDALAEESARGGANIIPAAGNHHTLLSATSQPAGCNNNNLISSLQQPQFVTSQQDLFSSDLKKEQHMTFILQRPEIPPWLACSPMPGGGAGPGPGPPPVDLIPSIFSSSSPRFSQGFSSEGHRHHQENPNPNHEGPNLPPFHQSTCSPHISATALLQKAAQMGATMSSSNAGAAPAASAPPPMLNTSRPQNAAHVSADSAANTNNVITTGAHFGLNLSSRDQFVNGLACSSYGNNTAAGSAGAAVSVSVSVSGGGPTATTFFQDIMMNSLSASSSSATTTGFEQGSTFEDDIAFGGNNGMILNRPNGKINTTSNSTNSFVSDQAGGGGSNQDGMMTRDFLGLRPLSHSDMIFNIAGLGGNCMNSSSTSTSNDHQNTSHKSWQGN